MRSIFTLLLITSFTALVAQKKGNCFMDYYQMFNERKALPVPDGVQNVVITIRNTTDNTCKSYQGQILVKSNKIAGQLKFKNTRGEFVKTSSKSAKLNPKYSDPKKPLKLNLDITNGMTANLLASDQKVVNLFFIDYLKPKQPSLVEAPEAK